MKTKILFLLLASAVCLQAADAPRTNSAAGETNAAPPKPLGAIPDATHKPVFTTNSITIGGQTVKYATETGMLPVLKPDGSSRASVFYVAYTRLTEAHESPRPVTFCFNGGCSLACYAFGATCNRRRVSKEQCACG